MQTSMAQQLRLPSGMPVHRFRPSPSVEIPPTVTELPLVDEKTPPDKQVQQVWHARARVFDLGDPGDLDDYNKVWQQVTDGTALRGVERIEFNQASGTFLALLRWVEFTYKVPESPGDRGNL